ncbi:Uncharacterised protein [Mycobacteroides abscessus subsp. abscessus]|nr:Uncharacterised protein [Mycobacteroides abscessus subsp. abscessus]
MSPQRNCRETVVAPDGDTVPGLASAAGSLPTIGIVVSDTLRSLSGGTDIGGGESSTGAASETRTTHRVGDAPGTPRRRRARHTAMI